jgi:hypothetical protein
LAWTGGVVPWYRVYYSLVVYRWREPIISRVLGCNQRPAVPEVYYPNKIQVLFSVSLNSSEKEQSG